MENDSLKKAEPYFFILITALNLIPVLSFKFFPTLDGPAHLYNSNLVNSLLFNGSQTLKEFFVFNHEPVPNWTGHVILCFFNFFLPAFLAEKALLLFYLIGLPWAFRNLIKTISPKNSFSSYFIFPFTYSFLFYLGFYNFSCALVFLMIALNYWIKHEENLFKPSTITKLFILITLTYFSHIFVFAILLVVIGLYTSSKTIIEITDSKNNKILIKNFVKKIGVLLLAAAVPLILFVYYFYSRPSTGNNNFYLSHNELTEWLKNIRPIISFSIVEEEAFTKKLFYLFSALAVIIVYTKINSTHYSKNVSFTTNVINIIKSAITVSDFAFFSLVLLLFLYFNLPDADGQAGFVSVRLALLFYIFLIIWIATQQLPRWLTMLSVVLVLYFNFRINNYCMNVTKGLSNTAVEYCKASEYILPNSVVLPINCSDNWLHGHFSNYLGIDKPMVILENYEAGTGYFPVKWNHAIMPNTQLGNVSAGNYPCLWWEGNTQNVSRKIDCVFVLGSFESKTDSCFLSIKKNVLDNYTLAYESEVCKLYCLKK